MKKLHLKIRGRRIAEQLSTLIKKQDKIIDIGCGSGWVSYYLNGMGYKVTLSDVNNCNQTNLPIVIYKNELPFKDKKFDAALLISVLHHSHEPHHVVEEAKRVAKKVIVLEETYSNPMENLWINFWEYLMEMELGMLRHYNFYHFYKIPELEKMLNKKPDKLLWNFAHTMRRGLFVIK